MHSNPGVALCRWPDQALKARTSARRSLMWAASGRVCSWRNTGERYERARRRRPRRGCARTSGESLLPCKEYEADPSLDGQLRVDPVKMGLHGALAQRELGGDLGIAKPAYRHPHDFEFSGCEETAHIVQ